MSSNVVLMLVPFPHAEAEQVKLAPQPIRIGEAWSVWTYHGDRYVRIEDGTVWRCPGQSGTGARQIETR